MSGAITKEVKTVFTVDDRTAIAVARIVTRLRAVAGMSGMEGVVASARNLQRSFGGMVGRIGAINAGLARMAALTGLGATAVAAGMYAIVRRSADAAGELDDLNDRFGIATRQMQAFRYAAVAGGQSGQTFVQAMVALNRNMGEAAAGRNRNALAMFQRLGISLRDSRGQIRSTADVLPQLAQAIMRNENAAVRQRIAVTAMGDAGAALLPMFASGAAGLQRMTDEWERYGYAFTDQDREKAKEYSDAMRRLSTALRGTADAIGTQLHPVLAPLVQQFADWVRANRDLIATNVGEWAQRVATFIREIDFDKLYTDISNFLTRAREIYDAIGGWKTIAIAVGLYIAGPFTAAIVTFAAMLTTKLIPVLGTAGRLLAGLGAGKLAQAVVRIVPAGAAVAASGAAAGSAAMPAAAAAGSGGWLGGLLGMGRAAGVAIGGAANLAGIAAAAGMILGSAEDPAVRRRSRARLDAGANGAQRIPDELWNAPDSEPASGGGGSWLSRLPSLFGQRPSPSSAVQPAQGEVNVRVRFDNVPPGARVQAETQGAGVGTPELDVGYAAMGAL